MSAFGLASLGVLALYLALFFMASGWAARAAGRSVWLFGQATGSDRWSAWGFRLAFGLALLGPLLQTAVPRLHQDDPLWLELGGPLWGVPGHFLAIAGAMLAFAGQIAMGVSWRVGVARDAVGDLVAGGLYEISRNPVFAGQLLLLLGVAFAIPSVPTVLAATLFWLSARSQIRTEERVLEARFGEDYRAYRARVPRWVGTGRPQSGPPNKTQTSSRLTQPSRTSITPTDLT